MDSQLIDEIDQVYILNDSKESEVAKRIVQFFPKNKVEYIQEEPAFNSGPLTAKEFSKSKKQLLIKPFYGQFFKQCPGAKPGLTCCNYFVLNLGQQCNMNCSYCYLQSYLNSPFLTIYSNIEQALFELKTLAEKYSNQSYRVGTGEIIDSLSLDPLTLYSIKLIEFFREYPSWSLELKTKSSLVDQFIKTPHSGNIIVSWSINPQKIIDSEEFGTASFKERIHAARKCRDQGFQIGFNLDPMIWHPDWKFNYKELVEEIVKSFEPNEVKSISIGALRFPKSQKKVMRERFSFNTLVNQAEVFPGKDGKLRYDLETRTEMFKWAYDLFKSNSPKWRVWLCMETPEAWAFTKEEDRKKDLNIKEFFKPLPLPKSSDRPSSMNYSKNTGVNSERKSFCHT